MKLIITTLLFLLAVQVFGQQDIINVRNSVGQQVTVNGIVTNGDELGPIRYFQDGTAGIAAYGSTVSDIKRGDSITITGTLKEYNNLLELDPVASLTVIS
ncbi:MAG TPA: hypothetical protein VKA38_12450, partial [Draconibacterium sp.]|nr:hypothetical protein [Draconibacterium sp.]